MGFEMECDSVCKLLPWNHYVGLNELSLLGACFLSSEDNFSKKACSEKMSRPDTGCNQRKGQDAPSQILVRGSLMSLSSLDSP